MFSLPPSFCSLTTTNLLTSTELNSTNEIIVQLIFISKLSFLVVNPEPFCAQNTFYEQEQCIFFEEVSRHSHSKKTSLKKYLYRYEQFSS